MRFTFLSILIVLIVTSIPVRPQSPKQEVRAVWISSAGGDWPTSFDVKEQQRSLAAIFDRLQEAHFNTVFFQVRPRGNVFYRSALEPWASQLTGTLGKDPGYDPLAFALQEAHKRGLELHAWFNVAKVWGSENLPAHPQHVTRTHRDWVKLYEGEWWLDLGNPNARDYTLRLVKELVSAYDIDGLHFDYIRYPSESFEDWKSFTQWGDGVERNEWRRNNVTAFVRDAYEYVRSVKPWVKVGSAPLGIYRSIPGAQSTFSGYSGVFQDSRRWLREGIHDYLAPQLYWTIGEQKNPNDPDFYSLSSDWVDESSQRHIYIGIGAYREQVQDELKEQLRMTREEGAQGQSFFRYENVEALLDRYGKFYPSPALYPPMPWKDSIPPNAPKDVAVLREGANMNITWKEPDVAKDKEPVYRYVVYRSTEKKIDTRRGENIAAILPGTERSFRDASTNGREYFYTVMALDRAGNESGAPVKTVSEIQRILARYERPTRAVILSHTPPDTIRGLAYILFDLPSRLSARLIIRNTLTGDERVVLNEPKNPGLTITAVDLRTLPAGPLEYRLTAGDTTLVRSLKK